MSDILILLVRLFVQFNGALFNNQDPNNQTENDETPVAECPNENDTEDGNKNQTSVIPNFFLIHKY